MSDSGRELVLKERTVAILVCFFLGGLGIHQFYLGKKTAGILYIAFSWTFIPSILAFFDFLGLCFMSEREFNARFNYSEDPHVLQQGSGYPVAPRSKSSTEATATLYELKKLYEDGIITAEEYEVKRRKMLDDI